MVSFGSKIETVDPTISNQVRMLFEMNLSHVLSTIFQYCGGSQLCAIAQVIIPYHLFENIGYGLYLYADADPFNIVIMKYGNRPR